VPAYFDPSADQADWNTLITAAAQVPLIAVMNPNSGPGGAADPSYASTIIELNNAGGQVIGYVHTSYGGRLLSDVEQEVASYVSWYAVKGIFIDEMASSATTANLDYYEQLASYIRTQLPGATIVANPGGAFDQAFADHQTADIYIDLEDTQANVHAATQAAWEAGFPASTFAEISIETTGDSAETAWLVANRRLGWLYTTTLPLNPNPYATLPADFTASLSSL
jgi:hypothetical protein